MPSATIVTSGVHWQEGAPEGQVSGGLPSFGRKTLCLDRAETVTKKVLLAQTSFDFPPPPARRRFGVTQTAPTEGEGPAAASPYVFRLLSTGCAADGLR